MTDLPDNPVHAGDGAWVLVQKLVNWLRHRGEPDSGIRYEEGAGWRSSRVELHGIDATFVASHFHGSGATQLADALQSLLAQMQKVEGENERLRKEKGKLHDYANMRDVQIVDAVSLLGRLRHWIEDEVGAELPFNEIEASRFAALCPTVNALSAINTQEGKE